MLYNPKKERENFLLNLTILRKKHNLTQKQMAEMLGIGIASWRMIEHGEMPPRLSSSVVNRAADAFGVNAAELFSEMEHDSVRYAKQIISCNGDTSHKAY